MVILTVLVLFLAAFIFWQRLKGLGFKIVNIFDLLSLTFLASLLGGKLFSPDFFRIFISKFKWSTESFLATPLFFPAALFFGLVTFFYYLNRRKWSVFAVGDQASSIVSGSYLVFSIWYLIVINRVSFSAITSDYAGLGLVISSLILFLLNIFIFKKQFFKGFGLFTTLIGVSVLSGFSDGRTLTLTFLGGVVILSLAGIIRRMRLNIMNSPLDLITTLKHRLRGKKEEIVEEQLRLPQDDPFLQPGRIDDNSPEADMDELAGHLKIEAEGQFLKESEKRVDAALDKVKSGTYGVCSNCQKTIEPARLEADPTAVLCIECAKKLE